MQADFDDDIFCTDFHGSEDLLYTGLINGDVCCTKVSLNDNKTNLIWTRKAALDSSCRGLQANAAQGLLYAAFQDSRLQCIDLERHAIVSEFEKIHSHPVSVLKKAGENLVATGDDEGSVRVWDIRCAANEPVVGWDTVHHDYISDLEFIAHKKSLVTTSADGHLSLLDLRFQNKAKALSEQQDDELLSVAVVKSYKKVLVGTQEGLISIFSYGQWKDSSDRFPGHPSSVNCILPIDDDTIATGSADGLVRVLSILPNKLIGAIGDHGDLPVENLAMNHSKNLIASSSHDRTVRFWNIGAEPPSETVMTPSPSPLRKKTARSSKWQVSLLPSAEAESLATKKKKEKRVKLKAGLKVEKDDRRTKRNFFVDL